MFYVVLWKPKFTEKWRLSDDPKIHNNLESATEEMNIHWNNSVDYQLYTLRKV